MAEDVAQRAPSATEKPSLLDLFLAFAGIAALGFGGVLPWARRMLVEQRRWLTPDEFVEVLSLGQFLPGGNILNVAVVVGQRFHGPLGSIAGVTGLMVAPMAIVITAGSLFLRYGQIPRVHDALDGVTAAAVGLILGMLWKMASPFFNRRALVPLGFAVAAFLAVGVAQVTLPLVLLILVPASVAFAWVRGS